MISNRDRTIDILRGLAIFTMVAANMAPDMLAEPHPLWFRFYGSFAAPLFILISGMMVAFTSQTRYHDLKYFSVRGILILFVGVLFDIMWKYIPFMTVDVLYLIGISLPLAYLFLSLNTFSQWLIVIFIFLVTPLFQKILGYTDYPTELYLWGEPTVIVENQTNVLNHWLVDGWFPIFPWLGFSLLGVNFAKIRWKSQSNNPFSKKLILITGIGIFAVGCIIWYFYPGKLLTRAGYSELFYPPTIGYVITAIGLILILFFIADWKSQVIIYRPLQAIGESPLFMYILHLALIEWIIAPVWSEENIRTFFLVYIALSAFLILTAYGLRFLKAKWKDRPFLIRVLLGT